MAEGLFRSRLGSEAANWRVESAGTWARYGDTAAQRAQYLLAERGIDLSQHRSRIVSAEMLREFDLILTMEQGQMEALKIEFPEAKNRIHMLTEMVDQHYDIEDPMGGATSEFRHTLKDLENIFTNGFEKINQLASHEDR
jgi:protein-tyrosine-phosphatase